MRVSSASTHRSPAIERQRQRRAYSAASRRPSAAEQYSEPIQEARETSQQWSEPAAAPPLVNDSIRNLTDPTEASQAAEQSTVVTIHVVDKPRKGM